MLYLAGEEMEPLRAVVRELVTLPEAARRLAGRVSGLHIKYNVGAGEHPFLGLRLAPHRAVERAGGSRTKVAELLHAGRGVLIVTDGDGGPAELAARWADRVDVITGAWADQEADHHDAPQARAGPPRRLHRLGGAGRRRPRSRPTRWFGAPAAV